MNGDGRGAVCVGAWAKNDDDTDTVCTINSYFDPANSRFLHRLRLDFFFVFRQPSRDFFFIAQQKEIFLK